MTVFNKHEPESCKKLEDEHKSFNKPSKSLDNEYIAVHFYCPY